MRIIFLDKGMGTVKRNFCLLLFLSVLISCSSSSPTETWLVEYGVLLQQGIEAYTINPTSNEMRNLQTKISEKEAEVDGLLRNVSMQEQINFLSRYYDMRVNFYYSVQ